MPAGDGQATLWTEHARVFFSAAGIPPDSTEARPMAPPRLVLSGYFGFGNLGDEAILEATVASLRKHCPEVEITALMANPELAHSLAIQSVPRKSPWPVLRSLAGCDLLLSGGGGLLQDSTGPGSVFYYLGVCALAKLLGKRVMFFCQGFGPVKSRSCQAAVRWLGNRLDLITLRDDQSADEMRQLGVKRPPLRVTADPALLLEPAPTARLREILSQEGLSGEIGRLEGPTGRHPGVGPLVAVTVRPWPNLPLEAIAQALKEFREREQARYLLIPFHPSKDREPSQRLVEALEGQAYLIKGDYAPREITGLLRCCDMVVGMRLHSLILACAAGIPLIGLSYDPKVERFCRRAGGLPLDLEEISSTRLVEALTHLLEGRAHQRRQQQKCLEPMVNQAERSVQVALSLAKGEPVSTALEILDASD